MNTVEKIVEILSDKALQSQIAACTSKEDAMKLLAEHGVDASVEDLRTAVLQMKEAATANENGEVSEEALEKVSGGWFFPIDRFLTWVLG